MERLYSLWDELGYFSHCEYFIEGEQPVNAIELLPDGFIKPRLIEGEIIETATSEEIIQYNRQFVPKVISQRQLRTQLLLDGFNLDNIQIAINSLSQPDKSIAQVAWDYAVVFERESPLLISLAVGLGMTESDLDNIFLNASGL